MFAPAMRSSPRPYSLAAATEAEKIFFMIWCYMMVRWTFVRPRVDQLMDFEWKFLLPVNLVLLVVGAAYITIGG